MWIQYLTNTCDPCGTTRGTCGARARGLARCAQLRRGACNSLCFRDQAINSVDVTIACRNPLRVVCCSASWSRLTPRRCASRSINRSEHPVSLSDPDNSGQVAIGAQWPNHGRRHLGDRVTGVRRPTGRCMRSRCWCDTPKRLWLDIAPFV